MTHNTLSEKDENYSCLKTYSDLQFAVPECHQLQKMAFTDVTLLKNPTYSRPVSKVNMQWHNIGKSNTV